jgi:hypothetical protein
MCKYMLLLQFTSRDFTSSETALVVRQCVLLLLLLCRCTADSAAAAVAVLAHRLLLLLALLLVRTMFVQHAGSGSTASLWYSLQTQLHGI